jgi:hypothetical protein
MSKRRDDDSRPSASALSQRATLRDVPAAKYKDAGVGTVAPRGLRGPSLLPGQGAPERVVPDEVELAVLRDAETLDGPKVARAVAGRRALPDSRSTSPTAVSVEVPRARSIPAQGEYVSTPPSPSVRSIQSGTLMSIGSVDPRAPTELSLPSPRPMSVSERAAYLGPEAVVDRTQVKPRRALPAVVDNSPERAAAERPAPPSAKPQPKANPGSATAGTGSGRPSLKADSVSPPAQDFARIPLSYSPVSHSPTPTPMKPPRPTPTPMRPPRPTSNLPQRPEAVPSVPSPASSGLGVPPKFQIHSELDALPHERQEDAFDLRSASTQREPLASRKAQPSADWTPHGPPSASSSESQLRVRATRSSSPAVTILVDRGRESAPPASARKQPPRAAVPLSWVLGAAAFAVILAMIVAFVLRPSAAPQAASPLDGRASAAAPSVPEAVPHDSVQPSAAPGSKRSGAASASAPRTAKSAARTASSPASSGSAAPPTPVDPNSKLPQSIY